MMRRTCGCGRVTTADLPPGMRGGTTCDGPNVTAAATRLSSQDVIGIERTADHMSTLLGVEVCGGFVSTRLTRLDTALIGPEIEDALKAALRAGVVGHQRDAAPMTDEAISP
jgi:hypothetical protein